MTIATSNTDYYSECETGFANLIRTLTTYFVKDFQVADDDTVLAKGADYFVIYRPGAFPNTPVTDQTFDYDWEVTFDLCVRYKAYKVSWTKFKAIRAAIINLVGANPTLQDTANVLRTRLSTQERASYLRFSPDNGTKPNFIIQTMIATITQRVEFQGGEF